MSASWRSCSSSCPMNVLTSLSRKYCTHIVLTHNPKSCLVKLENKAKKTFSLNQRSCRKSEALITVSRCNSHTRRSFSRTIKVCFLLSTIRQPYHSLVNHIIGKRYSRWFLSRVSMSMHEERNIVMANLSVLHTLLFYVSECIYRQTLSSFWYRGNDSSFLSATAVTKVQG